MTQHRLMHQKKLF